MKDPDGLLLRMALSMYLGERCQGCGKIFDTVESLDDTVWWPHDGGRIGHKTCFEADQAKGGDDENTVSDM